MEVVFGIGWLVTAVVLVAYVIKRRKHWTEAMEHDSTPVSALARAHEKVCVMHDLSDAEGLTLAYTLGIVFQRYMEERVKTTDGIDKEEAMTDAGKLHATAQNNARLVIYENQGFIRGDQSA